MAKLLTQAEYARYRKEKGLIGQTPAAVNKKIKGGGLSFGSGALVRQDGKVLLDPDRADAEWAGNTDPAMQRAEPPGPKLVREERDDGGARAQLSLNDFRTKTEASKALKAKIEVDQLRGTILERAHVESAVFEAMRLAREQLRVMPGKLAVRLAHATAPEQCRAILEEEVRTILDDLSRRFANLGNPGPGDGPGHHPTA